MTKDDQPRLSVESGQHEGAKASLVEGTNFIGRSSKCALVLNKTEGVSRQHAQIKYRLGTYSIMDLDSRHGTLVNGEEVVGRYPLNDGDRIEICGEAIVFRGPSGRAVTRTSAHERAILEKAPVQRVATPPPSSAPVAAKPSGEFRRVNRTDEFVMRDITNPKGPLPLPSLPPPSHKERSAALPKKHAPPAPPVIVENREVTHDEVPLVVPANPSAIKWLALLVIVPLLVFCFFDLGFNQSKITKSIFGNEASSKKVATQENDEALKAEKGALAKTRTVAEAESDNKAKGEVKDKAGDEVKGGDEDKGEVEDKGEDESEDQDKTTKRALLSIDQAKAPLSGKLKLKVRKGSSVRAGQSIGSVRGIIQSPISERKLKTLKREERYFARVADKNDRAKRELRTIRREIAKINRRTNITRTIRSPIDGVVTRIDLRSGASVQKGDVVLEIRTRN